MSRWHKGPKGSQLWTRSYAGMTATIKGDYIALTSTTWWVVTGIPGFEGRSFATLRTAKRLVDQAFAKVGK